MAAVLFEVSPLTIDHALQFLYDIRKLKQYIDSNQGRRLSAQTIEFVDLYLVIGCGTRSRTLRLRKHFPP